MTFPPLVANGSLSSEEPFEGRMSSPIKRKKSQGSLLSTGSPMVPSSNLLVSSSLNSLILHPSLSSPPPASSSNLTVLHPGSSFSLTDHTLAKNIIQTERIRKIRWRLLREIYLISTERDEYKNKNFEQLFDLFSTTKVNLGFFIMKFLNFYQFDNKLQMDIKLKKLFLTYTNSSLLLLGAKKPSTELPTLFSPTPNPSSSFNYTFNKLGSEPPSFQPTSSALLKNLTNPYYVHHPLNTTVVKERRKPPTALSVSLSRMDNQISDVDDTELNRTNFLHNLASNQPMEDDMSSCNDKVDVLHLLISFKILYCYKFTYNRSLELILLLFDYFLENLSTSKLFELKNSSNIHSKILKNTLKIKNPDEILFFLFFIPCLHENEVVEMKRLFQFFMEDVHQCMVTACTPNSITRADLSNLLSTKHQVILAYWNNLITLRLPKSNLLDRLNTNQIFHLDNFDRLIYDFKVHQAEEKYDYHLISVTFKEWKLHTIYELQIKKYVWIKYSKKLEKLFIFWLKITKINKRKKVNNILSRKFNRLVRLSHYFTRIKLYIKNNKKIQAVLGPSEIYNVGKKKIDLFMNHLRNYLYYRELRYNFKCWVKNNTKLRFFLFMYNHIRTFYLKKMIFIWKEKIVALRQHEINEYQINENQLILQSRLADVEDAQKYLVEYELKKKQEEEEAKKTEDEKKKNQIYDNYLMKKDKEKQNEENLVLQIQQEDRQKRIRSEVNLLKAKFNKGFIAFSEGYLLKTREKVKKFIEDPSNKEKLTIESSNLLAKFHENLSEVNRVKEKVLLDYLNIFVLFLDHFLKIKFAYGIIKKKKKKKDITDEEDINPVFNSVVLEKIKYNYYSKYFSDFFYSYDTKNKGYLSYSDFKQMIKDVCAPFNPAQVNKLCLSLDPYKVERIDYTALYNALDRLSPNKLEESAKNPLFFLPSNQFTLDELRKQRKNFPINFMFSIGSVWKLYVDPKENIICYHNLDTNEKVLEYQMTKELMETIYISNIYGENEEASLKYLRELRTNEWNKVIKNYMVNRIQKWYKKVKKRIEIKYKYNLLINMRKKNIDKTLNRIKNLFLNLFYNNEVKKKFYKQFFFTYEKFYDYENKKYYYYNHKTGGSFYDFPLKNYYPKFVNECEFVEWQPNVPEGFTYNDFLVIAKRNYMLLEEKKRNGECGTVNNPLKLTNDEECDTNEIVVSYTHKITGTCYPGKPDGFPICSMCCFELAIRFCKDCSSNYCFYCHSVHHSSPMGFFQTTPPSLEDITSEGFQRKTSNQSHTFTPSVCINCELCDKRAGLSCRDCKKTYCRICFYRVHNDQARESHLVDRV